MRDEHDSEHGDDAKRDEFLQGMLVDRLLGELPEDDAYELRHEIANDPSLAMESAELHCLFDDLRDLTVTASPRVGLAVRNFLDRRLRLRTPAPVRGPWHRVKEVLQITAIAASMLGAALLYRHFVPEPETTDQMPAVVEQNREPVLPVSDDVGSEAVASIGGEREIDGIEPSPRYLVLDQHERLRKPFEIYQMDPEAVSRSTPFARLDETSAEDVWMCATNALASLRMEFDFRMSPRRRRESIRAAGGSELLVARIDTLSDEVAQKIEAALDARRRGLRGDTAGGDDARTVTVQDVAMSLRALLATGSTLRLGEHRATVRRCSDWLLERLPELHGGHLATALAGLMDVAVVAGPKFGRKIGEHASRLTESIIYSQSGHRPSMLNWGANPAQLADAGQVLRLAPAFGIVDKEALMARSYLATHLDERIARSKIEVPDLLAALLYGFGDLVDRSVPERMLHLWRPRDLVPDDYVALLHVAWSRLPAQDGFADFYFELRGVAAMNTPERPRDAASMLLALSVSYAAPGSQQVYAVAMR